MKGIILFPVLLIAAFISTGMNAQSCNALNFQHLADIPSTCQALTMTMMHDAQGAPYLYVANKEAGLKIYNIANPASPQLVKTIATSQFDTLDVINLAQQDNYLYLALGNIFNSLQNAGMAIVDVTKPDSALVTGYYTLPSSGGGAGIVALEGNYAYLGAMQHGVAILDVSDKHNITFLSRLVPDINFPTSNPSAALYNARGMQVKNGIVYLCYDAGGIRIINTGDKLHPVETGRYSNPLLNGYPRAYNNAILDDTLLYVAADYCGLEVLNVADTANIRLTGTWNPYDCPNNNWFTSPLYANEIRYRPDAHQLFLSAGRTDMFVLDVSNPSAPDPCNSFGNAADTLGTWGIGLYSNQVYLSYICSAIPFQSDWTGITILSYSSPTSLPGLVETTLTLQPNPASGYIIFQPGNNENMGRETTVSLTNMLGQAQPVKYSMGGANEGILDVSGLSNGEYVLHVTTSNGNYSSRVIKFIE